MKPRFFTGALVAIVLLLSCFWFLLGGSGRKPQGGVKDGKSVEKIFQRGLRSDAALITTASTTIKKRISDKEFKSLRVDLPEPENAPWKGPFWNSSNFRDPETAKTALEVLPIWIRNELLNGHRDQAGKYLFSLLTYLEDNDKDLRNEAALILYKLGSRDERIVGILKDGIENGVEPFGQSKFYDGGRMLKRRAVILEHLRFYSDHSLDDFIEAVFEKLPDKGAYTRSGNYNSEAIELAKYLEAVGRPRTDEFWLAQIESGGDIEQAVSILRNRGGIDLLSVLRPKIDADLNSFTSRTAAALVYGMTGDPAYEPLLTKLVEEAIEAGSPVAGLELALKELLRVKSPQAETALRRTLASENQVLHEIALAALGQVAETSSIQIIKDYATPIIEKDLFPDAAFKALIEMGNQQGDAAYEALKQSVLARDGRSEADFDTLEFLKAHRSKLYR